MTVWTCLLAVALSEPPTMVPLLETLPEDGRWVKFDLQLKLGSQDQTLTWVAKSVGQFQQGGRDVRCIETDLTGGNEDIPPSCHRLLVPLDAFGNGKHPLGQAARMWVRRGSDAPESFNNLSDDAITSLFLAGATEDIKRLEQKETVPYQRGKLECDVFTGKSTQMIGDSKFGVTWTILRHDDVPFGLAGVRMKMTIEGETELIQVDMRLQDFGKDAKATLPELTP